MARMKESIEVNAPVEQCYDQWMRFEEFPQFMDHVKSVTSIGNNRWHWVVDGPLGKKLEWDAAMDGNAQDRMVSWHTVSDPDVGVQGAVTFEEVSPTVTRVTSTMQYEPPAGALGELVAQIFSNPQAMVKQDLENFKRLIESGGSTGTTGSYSSSYANESGI
jgi:uncharacterized membrane protein